MYSAQNEFEPFQVVVKPKSATTATITIGDFGSGITTEIHQVKYVTIDTATDNLGRIGPYPDPLLPVENGAGVALPANVNTALWFTVFVPPTTPSGDYTAQLTIGGVSLPVRLHVFNFALTEEPHVHSQMNFSHEAVLNSYSVPGYGAEYWMHVEKMKQFFIDHRLTPSAPLWSGGLTSGTAPYIDYDCNGNFTDNDTIWGFEQPAARFLHGTGLMSGIFSESFNNGTGFPSFMAVSFNNNDASLDQRPANFCGNSRGSNDWYAANNPGSAYNLEWKQYLTGIQNYLESHGLLRKAYYYLANEPQDQAGYDAVAWYSGLIKSAAPQLKLMVSEEPKAEIFNNPAYPGAKIDIWLPVLNAYNPELSHERELNFGETTWIYFLHGTRPPYFNPITLDHPGIESKLTGWFLWKYRIRGIAYYSMNNWSKNPWTEPMTDNHNGDTFMLYPPSETNTAIPYGSNGHRLVPSIRLELMRDSLEDYEYLYILNNNSQPAADTATIADSQAEKIIKGLTSYSRDDDFIYNLRRVIGLKNGGEAGEIPDIQPAVRHPRALGKPQNYYINFQDPGGSPTAEPLVVNGHQYEKIGWDSYDIGKGYGWYGDMAHVMYAYLSSGPNELRKSILYDDWGRQKTFEFDLPDGDYRVTVSVGWYDQWNTRGYSHQKIDIEGIPFIDDEATWNPDRPYLVRSRDITIADTILTMNMGIFNEYTMLNYLDIEAITPVFEQGDTDCSGTIGIEDVLAILHILSDTPVELSAECPPLQGDRNSDNRIDIEDALDIIEFIHE